jgi:hypothetical protein
MRVDRRDYWLLQLTCLSFCDNTGGERAAVVASPEQLSYKTPAIRDDEFVQRVHCTSVFGGVRRLFVCVAKGVVQRQIHAR